MRGRSGHVPARLQQARVVVRGRRSSRCSRSRLDLVHGQSSCTAAIESEDRGSSTVQGAGRFFREPIFTIFSVFRNSIYKKSARWHDDPIAGWKTL